MARLPIPGEDTGEWGEILNDYLSTALNSDGTLKSSSVTGNAIVNDTIVEAKLHPDVRTLLHSTASITDLSSTANATTVTVASSTGTDAVLGTATGSVAGVLTAADKTKLDGITTGATVNATDTQLRDRTTHTGVQAISTVTGLQAALDAKATTTHTHAIADVTNLQPSLDAKASTADLTTGLAGKANTTHNHAVSDTTGLQAALDSKAATSSLAAVATSGSYNDLTNQPTIPTITASPTAPGSPATGDMWVDTSA